MKKFLTLFIALQLCCYFNVNAQEKQERKSNLIYKGFVDIESGVAYNLNTAQIISTNNMQALCCITTTHGIQINNVFVGAGVGYYHSFRDKENAYPLFVTVRLSALKKIVNPFVEMRLGIVYDPHWVSTAQYYGALGGGFNIFRNIQLGCRTSIFSRPSRYFTPNVTFVLGYEF